MWTSLGCFLRQYADYIGFVGAFGTIVALVLAWLQTNDLKKINRGTTAISGDLESVVRELKSVAESLPTQDIGFFPEYVARLAPLIRKAKNRVIIVCDAPCYCIFSSRDLWNEYKLAMDTAKNNFLKKQLSTMSILWMDEKCRKKVLEEQFARNGKINWPSGIDKKKLADFIANEGASADVNEDTITYDDFEKLVEAAHKNIISGMRDIIGDKRVHRDLHLYFWIIDNQAVFAIPNYSDGGKGRAIWTRDANIIDGLQAISDRLHNQESTDPHASW